MNIREMDRKEVFRQALAVLKASVVPVSYNSLHKAFGVDGARDGLLFWEILRDDPDNEIIWGGDRRGTYLLSARHPCPKRVVGVPPTPIETLAALVEVLQRASVDHEGDDVLLRISGQDWRSLARTLSTRPECPRG